MSRKLVVSTVLCTHGTPSQWSWQAEITAYWIKVHFNLASSKGGSYEGCGLGIYLTTHTQTILTIIWHLGFLVAILHNHQLFWFNFVPNFRRKMRNCWQLTNKSCGYAYVIYSGFLLVRKNFYRAIGWTIRGSIWWNCTGADTQTEVCPLFQDKG